MNVTVTGPNAHGGMFHVHATGCRDLAHRSYATNKYERYEEDHASVESVVLSVYDNGIMTDDETYQDYLSEFCFFPCTDALPSEIRVN